MQTHSTLTKKHVVDQLTAQLAARRTLDRRRKAAYERLAQQVLGASEHTLHTFEPRTMPSRMAAA